MSQAKHRFTYFYYEVLFTVIRTFVQKKAKSLNIRFRPGKLFFGPEWIVLGVNNICNLHCKMCDVGTQTSNTVFAQNLTGTSPRNMPEDLIFRIIDQLSLYYPGSKLGYAFTEPLIYPHLISSLYYARQKNIYTAITTNALNLSQHAGNICEAGLDELFISLDGPQDVHNFIRGHKSSFQRAIEGLEKIFAHNRHPEVSVFCVITEWNINHLKEFAGFFSRYPLKNLGFMHTNFTPENIVGLHNARWGEKYPATCSNIEESQVTNIDLNQLWTEIHSIRSTRYPFTVSFSPEIYSEEKLKIFYQNPEKLLGKRCGDAFSNVMIKSDGSVIPAHGRCYNLTIGNIYSQELKDIWNSEAVSRFRKDLIQAGGLLPACSRCCSAFA